jgi:hypothetical protein
MFQLTSKTTGETVYFTDSYEAARQIEYTHNDRVHKIMHSGHMRAFKRISSNSPFYDEWQIEEIE